MKNDTRVHAGENAIGYVQGSVFKKSVKSSLHFLRKPPAIATDLSALEQAQAKGAETVEVHDLDTGRVYSSSIEQILSYGFAIDRGHGRQIALPVFFWDVIQK